MTATPPLRDEPDEPIGELFRDVLDLADQVAGAKAGTAYERITGQPRRSITCPECGRTSPNPDDVAQGYCGVCHWWTSDEVLGPARRAELAAVVDSARAAALVAEQEAAAAAAARRQAMLKRWARYMGPVTPDIEAAVRGLDEQNLRFVECMLDDEADRWRRTPPELRGLVLPDLPPAPKAVPVEQLGWDRGIYFRRDGSQVEDDPFDPGRSRLMTWARQCENFDRDWRVECAEWRYRGRRWLKLSTIFTGTCTNSEGYPRLWETALLPGPVLQWRWTSQEQAVAAHMTILEAFVGRRRARRITAADRRARARRIRRGTPVRWRVKGGRRG
jgi:hypothetical protein